MEGTASSIRESAARKAEIAARTGSWHTTGHAQGLASSLPRLALFLIAVTLCALLAGPALALTANVPARLATVQATETAVTEETADTGVLLTPFDGVNP
jgi:hypothetical protein